MKAGFTEQSDQAVNNSNLEVQIREEGSDELHRAAIEPGSVLPAFAVYPAHAKKRKMPSRSLRHCSPSLLTWSERKLSAPSRYARLEPCESI